MGLLDVFKRKNQASSATTVQTLGSSNHPYYQLSTYSPVGFNSGVYSQLRQAVPILDAAINKIVRLTEGFTVETGDEATDSMLQEFFSTINVGGNQRGINAFVSSFLDQLLTYGTALGEIVLDEDGIYALYNSELSSITLKRADNGIDVDFYTYEEKIKHPELLLYSVLNPKPNCLSGTSLLDGLPFVADILLNIYKTIGENWKHAGNVRYAVVCKPTDSTATVSDATNQAQLVADAWSDAMSSDTVKDFVAVGDVSVKVIGADNVCLDSEIPVRQLLEQIVAKTGIPPFMLGLSWSSTERMSTQQADILTTELESYRRILTPVIEKICNMYLAMNGIGRRAKVKWDDITLQDECELARAELYSSQADRIRREAEID